MKEEQPVEQVEQFNAHGRKINFFVIFQRIYDE
jgi:hypothetical protein